jgi:hypothetical protein
MLGLFSRKKKPEEKINYPSEIKCWNCEKLFSYEKAKFKPRKVGWDDKDNPVSAMIITKTLREMEKNWGNKEGIATSNQVFGGEEYEYTGKCPNCEAFVNCLWFGAESLEMNFKYNLDPIGGDVICIYCRNRHFCCE